MDFDLFNSWNLFNNFTWHNFNGDLVEKCGILKKFCDAFCFVFVSREKVADSCEFGIKRRAPVPEIYLFPVFSLQKWKVAGGKQNLGTGEYGSAYFLFRAMLIWVERVTEAWAFLTHFHPLTHLTALPL